MTYISTILWNIIIIKHVIPERYQKTNDGHQFLLHDSGPGEDPRMLIYATQCYLQFLSTARHWLMDGTFKIVPELFSQLYTIHALCGSQSIPCVYGLLPNKRQVMYMSFLEKLKEADATLNPDTVTTDYEVATSGAARSFSRHLCTWLFVSFIPVFVCTAEFRQMDYNKVTQQIMSCRHR